MRIKGKKREQSKGNTERGEMTEREKKIGDAEINKCQREKTDEKCTHPPRLPCTKLSPWVGSQPYNMMRRFRQTITVSTQMSRPCP